MIHDSRHCLHCGTPTAPRAIEGRERRACHTCGWVHWLNPASAAAGLILVERRVLLVRRSIQPCAGQWALPAGYQEIDEPAEEAARREIREECGLEVEIEGLHALLWIPGPHRPANLAVFRCRPVTHDIRPGPDVADAAWFDLAALPQDLAFDNGPQILWPLRDKHLERGT